MMLRFAHWLAGGQVAGRISRWEWRLLLVLATLSMGACAPLHLEPSPTTAKPEAIVVLPGLGMRPGQLQAMRGFASAADQAGFDLFLVDYRRRGSIDDGVESLRDRLDELELGRYQQVHVFAYILGGYTLNRFLEIHPMENLGKVAYDRSPLQEIAPKLAMTGAMAVPAKLAFGPVIADLAATPYTPLPRERVTVGLVIENRATTFVRARREQALALRPLSFDAGRLGQEYAAVIHVPFNHDEMYENFDVIGPELLHFFRNGTFTPRAARQPLGIDPFSELPDS